MINRISTCFGVNCHFYCRLFFTQNNQTLFKFFVCCVCTASGLFFPTQECISVFGHNTTGCHDSHTEKRERGQQKTGGQRILTCMMSGREGPKLTQQHVGCYRKCPLAMLCNSLGCNNDLAECGTIFLQSIITTLSDLDYCECGTDP